MRHRSHKSWNTPIRNLLPPAVYIVLAGLVIGSAEATWFLLHTFFGETSDELLLIRDWLIVATLSAYGLYRVIAFHPLFRKEYLAWLRLTPWQADLPLPLGPIGLAMGDFIIVGVLCLLLTDARPLRDPQLARLSASSGFLAFLQTHALMVTTTVWLTGPRKEAYLASFLLALSVRVSGDSIFAALAIFVVGAFIAHQGLKGSLQLFPWQDTLDWAARIKTGWKAQQQANGGQVFDGSTSPDRVPPRELGWPFGVCSPYVAPEGIPRRDKLIATGLSGFWLHAFLFNSPDEVVQGVSFLLLPYGLIALIVMRMTPFGGNHAWPISFLGRILTMRWIIPGYDCAVLGPLGILIVSAGGAAIGHFVLEIPLRVLTPVVFVATCWTATLAGPDPERWKLTAPARLVHGRLNPNAFEELS